MCSMSWRRPQPAGVAASARSTMSAGLSSNDASARAAPARRMSRRVCTPRGLGGGGVATEVAVEGRRALRADVGRDRDALDLPAVRAQRIDVAFVVAEADVARDGEDHPVALHPARRAEAHG